MATLPLFGIGMQGKTPVVTAKRLQNFYIEYRPQGEKTHVVAYGFPGLDLFVDFGDTAARGLLSVEQNDLLYPVHRGMLWEVNNAGVMVSRGTLNTQSGSVGMAHNGVQIMTVDGTNGYIYNTGTLAFAQITDGDFPTNPTSVTFIDGYFVAGFDNGRFYISAPYDGLAWDALDFAKAESNPDRLVRVFADHGELILFGDISTEFWGNSGATDFPFAKLQGADSEWGLAARYSVAKFDDSVALLCKNRMGEVIVGRLSGHRIEPLSTPDLDTIINDYAVTSDATAHSYLLGGHPMYQLNFPAAGFSWNYDGLTKQWSPRTSYQQTRQRCEFGVQYLSKTVLTDASNGRLYRLNPATLTENGETIEGEIIGEHWDHELIPITISRLRVDLEVGTDEGTAGSMTVWDPTSGTLWDISSGGTFWDYQQEIHAQIMLSLSRDDGKTWGTELWRSMGALGHYKDTVEWRRLGTSRRWTAKLRITDPVKRTIIGAYVNPES